MLAETRTFPWLFPPYSCAALRGRPSGFLIGGLYWNMVDVVRGNFAALLPRIEECIRECDFIGESERTKKANKNYSHFSMT